MKKIDINNIAQDIGMNIILKYKYLFIIFLIIALILCFFGLIKINMDSSNESFFSKNDETVIKNEKFKKLFGNEDFIFILIEADDVFTFEVLNYIRELTKDIEDNLPFVKESLSLTDVEFTETIDDELIIEDLIQDEIPMDKASLDLIRKKALSKDTYVDRIITKDSKKTGIAISFERIPEYVYFPVGKNFNPMKQINLNPDKIIMNDKIFYEIEEGNKDNLVKVYDPRKLIYPALKVILNRHINDQIKVTATGVPVIDFETDTVILSDGAMTGLIALIIGIVLLFIIFRNLLSVIAPFFVMLFTIIIVLGIMGYFAFPINLSAIIIIPLLLVISVSYSIHFMNHFLHIFKKDGDRTKALSYMFYHSVWPCFLTCITTVMGFISFLAVPIKPIRNMGIICGLGVFITYVLVLIIIPVFFSFGKKQKQIKNSFLKLELPEKFFVKWADFVIDKALISVIITIIIVVSMIFFSFKINVDSELMNMIGEKVKYVNDSKYVTDRLGGIYSIEILVELPENDMAKNPDVLKNIENIDKMVNKWDETSLSFSLVNLIKDINMTMNNNDAKYNVIPDFQNLIAQYLILYEMAGGDTLNDWIDYDYKTLRLSVQAKKFSTTLVKKFKELEIYAGLNFPVNTKFTITGDMPVMIKMMNMLSYGQIYSVFMALIAITIMMIIVLGSFKAGLISMIPNIIPIGVITGIMGLLKYDIDLLTVMIAPMIIGIAVDDTVHYFVHFKQELNTYNDYRVANKETFKKIGKAIIFTSVILILGYGVFCVSKIKSMVHLAVLSGAGILSALIADLFITPALFVFLKPFNKRKHVK